MKESGIYTLSSCLSPDDFPSPPGVWEVSISLNCTSSFFMTPTPSTSSPPNLHFIRYNKHTVMLIKTVNRHLLPSPLTLDLSVMINQKRTHSVMGLDFIFGLQRPKLKSRRLQETPDEKNVSTTITIIDIFWSHRREPDMTKGGSRFCVLKQSKIRREKKTFGREKWRIGREMR